jgi:hypothetical protein
MKCPRCQHENRSQARFCEDCAGPLKGVNPVTQSHSDDLKAEVENLRQALTESLEEQTATSEVLKVISRSTFHLQPVLSTVVKNAARVCGATDSHICLFEVDRLRIVASHGEHRPSSVSVGTEISAIAASVAGRAVCERRSLHIHDLEVLPETEYPEMRAWKRSAVSERARSTMPAWTAAASC